MRVLHLIVLIAVLVTAVAAWTKEDHEIFDLVSAVEKSEGKGTNFYSWLDVPSTASTARISKAYRKKSLQLHPDKNKGLKDVHERFARLGLVAGILRDSAKRERYDFFYKNGVPVWRGTGYYYSRFRPGLGTVLTFLVIITSVVQHMVQRMSYNRDLKRIEQVIEQARTAAWGSKLNPVEGQRKVKVNLGGAPRLDEEGNVVPGRMMDMLVEGSQVFIVETDGSLLPVDSDTAIAPSIKRTWFLSLVTRLLEKVVQRDGTSIENGLEQKTVEGESDDGSSASSDVAKEANKKNGRVAATSMAGGRRRKVVRKK